MDIDHWLRHFRRNRRHRIEPDWQLPVIERRARIPVLARSLARFQLGETGGGRRLQRKAARGLDARHREVLRLFVDEEREHARLLALLVHRFDGTLIERHWTSALFKLIRRALRFDWEIQVLLSAEIVGSAFYIGLAERSPDPVLHQACRIILRDEARHLEFHRSYFCARYARRAAWRRRLWSAQFSLVALAVGWAAWFDHRACLRAYGIGRRDFLALVGRFARHVAAAVCPLPAARRIEILEPPRRDLEAT
jgi:hypothetical protein